jgi:hypothetical protein
MFSGAPAHENITVQFSKQGENNRETYVTCGCSSRDVPEHFGSSNSRAR